MGINHILSMPVWVSLATCMKPKASAFCGAPVSNVVFCGSPGHLSCALEACFFFLFYFFFFFGALAS